MPSTISVVIPVYNGALTLRPLCDRLLAVLHSLEMRFEIILVNDGSRDGSWPLIRALTREHAGIIHGVDLMRNYGQHNALLCGIRMARHEVIVTIDDDLQQPPEDMPLLLDRLNQPPGYDVVYGVPSSQQHGTWRNAASRTAKAALRNFFGADTGPIVSAFRVFRSTLKPAFDDCQSPLLSVDVLLTWATTRFGTVAVRREPRVAGESNYKLGSLIRHTFNMLTGFSVVPLQLTTLAGIGLIVVGIAALAYVTGKSVVTGRSVAGIPFLASMITIFSGAQLFSIGIVGEYLGRVHMKAIGKPPYLVRTLTDPGEDR
jgi:glycosyltransferase involved in cell wall biosynthesis